jgi:hypothetical protein
LKIHPKGKPDDSNIGSIKFMVGGEEIPFHPQAVVLGRNAGGGPRLKHSFSSLRREDCPAENQRGSLQRKIRECTVQGTESPVVAVRSQTHARREPNMTDAVFLAKTATSASN